MSIRKFYVLHNHRIRSWGSTEACSLRIVSRFRPDLGHLLLGIEPTFGKNFQRSASSISAISLFMWQKAGNGPTLVLSSSCLDSVDIR
jgi:hypothetical protein